MRLLEAKSAVDLSKNPYRNKNIETPNPKLVQQRLFCGLPIWHCGRTNQT